MKQRTCNGTEKNFAARSPGRGLQVLSWESTEGSGKERLSPIQPFQPRWVRYRLYSFRVFRENKPITLDFDRLNRLALLGNMRGGIPKSIGHRKHISCMYTLHASVVVHVHVQTDTCTNTFYSLPLNPSPASDAFLQFVHLNICYRVILSFESLLRQFSSITLKNQVRHLVENPCKLQIYIITKQLMQFFVENYKNTGMVNCNIPAE